jgi:hypothetical protein
MARLVQALFAALRTIERDPVSFLLRWKADVLALLENERGLHDLEAIVYYTVERAAATQREEVLRFMQEHLGERGRRLAGTIAGSWYEEGREKGREEGREEGREDGRAEGRRASSAQAVVTVLEARGFAVDDATRARIFACRDESILDRWHRRAVLSDRIEDVFDPTR